jgi:hypothetical protein
MKYVKNEERNKVFCRALIMIRKLRRNALDSHELLYCLQKFYIYTVFILFPKNIVHTVIDATLKQQCRIT